jgi:hypothetical protein
MNVTYKLVWPPISTMVPNRISPLVIVVPNEQESIQQLSDVTLTTFTYLSKAWVLKRVAKRKRRVTTCVPSTNGPLHLARPVAAYSRR